MTSEAALRPNDPPIDGSTLYREIQQFYATQALLLDDGLLDEDALRKWAETFTEDATFWINFLPAPVEGRDAIVGAIMRSTTHVRERRIRRRHWFSQLRILGQVDGAVTTRYYALVVATAPSGQPEFDACTVANDTLVLTKNGLATRSRKVRRDDIPDAAGPAETG